MARLVEGLFDKTLRGLERQLDLTWQRNQAISSNIANAETPRYTAIDVNFGRELDKAFQSQAASLQKTNAKHVDTASLEGSHIVADYSGVTKPDGNNVDIDLQMGRLASNSSAFVNATNVVRKKLGLLRLAIREAGR